MEAIWGVEYPSKPIRYDYKAVTERMLALLKEYDEVAPGRCQYQAPEHPHRDFLPFRRIGANDGIFLRDG